MDGTPTSRVRHIRLTHTQATQFKVNKIILDGYLLPLMAVSIHWSSLQNYSNCTNSRTMKIKVHYLRKCLSVETYHMNLSWKLSRFWTRKYKRIKGTLMQVCYTKKRFIPLINPYIIYLDVHINNNNDKLIKLYVLSIFFFMVKHHRYTLESSY